MCKKMLFIGVCMVVSVSGLPQAQAANPTAAMVVSSADLSLGFDRPMYDRLAGLGFDVTVVPSSDVAGGTFTRAIADTYNLLLISESIGSSSADNLIGTTAPVMHNESYGWDNWHFTTGANMHWATGSSIDIVNDTHPVAVMAGVKMGSMPFFSSGASWTTDSVSSLAPGATLIAQIIDGGTACAIIFVMDAGAQLTGGGTTLNRAAGFSIPGNGPFAAAVMTPEAWALFDATVRWLTHSASPGVATAPHPEDSATDVPTNVALSWTPGKFAETHNVYFDTDFDDVNDGIALVSPGQDANSYDPGRLEFGTTYYWRVDEVNAPPDSTVFTGPVWSFTVEPFARPIATDSITATASSSLNADSGPEKTVDGSGLNALDQHDTAGENMWVNAVGQEAPVWIQYEFGRVYKLDQMWVWNSNSSLEWLAGLGVKTATIEYSTDGATWTELPNVPEFAQAPGAADYAHNTEVDFDGVAARFVRITCTSSWGGRGQYGLSEVRFLTIPVQARDPNPATGATDVSPDTALSWRAGREAASHEIHLDTDMQAVADSTTPAATVSQATYSPANLKLDTTYYWKVVEVNQAESPSAWAGEVWSFSTSQYLVLDDFESYTDASPERVFQTWIDGLGFSPDEFFQNGNPGNGTGAIVGYDPTVGSIMEYTIVHGGKQSMPLSYEGPSETTRTFAPAQDWTRSGIKRLVLFFQGAATNAPAELYVKVNGVEKAVDADVTAESWQEVDIELASLGVDLQHVTSLAISIQGTGSGLVFVDDIRLCAPLSDY